MVTAIGALGGMFTGGGDGMRVGEDGHPASHRPNTAGSSLAFGDRYEGRTVMVAARLMATLFIIWSRRAGGSGLELSNADTMRTRKQRLARHPRKPLQSLAVLGVNVGSSQSAKHRRLMYAGWSDE